MNRSLIPAFLALLLPAAYASEPDYRETQGEIRSAVEGAKREMEEARKAMPQEGAGAPKTYAGCTFQSDKTIELEVLHPAGADPSALEIIVSRPNENTVEFAVETVRDYKGKHPFPARIVRVQERAKGRRILDVLLSVDDRGFGALRLGENGDTPDDFELDRSLFMAGMDLSGQMRFQFTKSFSWGFLGMGGKTLLAVHCRVPMEKPAAK